MPELPEVELIRRGLAQWVAGRVITDVTVLHARAVRRHLPGPRDFADRLTGRRVLAVNRRGKYLWFPLDSEDVLVGHLGMSGQLLIRPPQAAAEPHLRVRFALGAADRELRFVDQRTFGGFAVESASPGGGMAAADGPGRQPGVAEAALPATIRHIALDPLDEAFDVERFQAALRRRHTGLKRALLDQSLVSGIGNIYADEALWRARLHYAHPTDEVTLDQAASLVAGVCAVMTDALAAGGTSFDTLYVNVNGESGYFSRSLQVYGQVGRDCGRCGTPIERVAFMNRSSFLCPRCQPRPRAPRW